MIFQEDYGGFVSVKCEKCGTIIKKHRVLCKQYGDEYHFKPPIICECGSSQKIIYKNKQVDTPSNEVIDNSVKCPFCGSTQITANNKGFKFGNAAIGGVLLGPVGLLGGFIGSNKVIVTCLNCGKQWKAGKY